MSLLALLNTFNDVASKTDINGDLSKAREAFMPVVRHVSSKVPSGDKAGAQEAVANLRAWARTGFGTKGNREQVFPFVSGCWNEVRAPFKVTTTVNRDAAKVAAALAKYA